MWLPLEEVERSPLLLGWLDREPLAQILQRAQENRLLRQLAAEGLGRFLERLCVADPSFHQPRAEGHAL